MAGHPCSSIGTRSPAVAAPDMLTSEQALEQARAFARAERDKGGWTWPLTPII